jgi:hypothetical protein
MKASEGKCFQGRLSRLINVLSGYHQCVAICISPNEQIGNVVIMLKKQNPNVSVEEFIELFKIEMKDRDYGSCTLDEWIRHIIDNY